MPAIYILGTLHNAETGQPLPGWHINSTGEIPALSAHLVSPATPRLVFAGVPTFFYTFESQQQAEQALAGIDLGDPPVDQVRAVTMRQARLWLLGAGLLGAVEQAVAASADPALRVWWEYSSAVHIDAPPLGVLLPALGLAPEQLPEIFAAAAQL